MSFRNHELRIFNSYEKLFHYYNKQNKNVNSHKQKHDHHQN